MTVGFSLVEILGFDCSNGKSLDCGSNGLEEASKHSDKKLEPTNRPEAPQKFKFLSSSFKKEDERIEAPKEVKEGEAILIDDEMVAASLLLELLRHGKENKIKRRQMKKQKSVRKAEVYSMDEDCDSDSTLTQQIHQLRKCQSNPDSVKEPCQSAELGLVSFSKAKYKRKGKSGMGDRTSSNGKIKKRKAPDGGLNSLSLADKKRKLCPSLPVQEETKELKGLKSPTELEGLTDSTMEEELRSPKCFSTDGSDTEAVSALPSTATLVDPRAIAKQYKLNVLHPWCEDELGSGSLSSDVPMNLKRGAQRSSQQRHAALSAWQLILIPPELIVRGGLKAGMGSVAVAERPSEAWDQLHTTFANKSQTRIYSLRDLLGKISLNPEMISDYLREICSLAEELASDGSPISNEELIVKFLSGLGPESREISAAIRAHDTPISYEEHFDKLPDHELFLKHEELKKHPAPIMAQVAQRTGSNNSNNSSNQ
ncbi:hypothetical protein RJ639_027211 [Escallonia herrerae]|uniref:Uncharacterized protein n=1 Tax=Escallonia herrerae TaxID=1293975 RepID=A0AA88XIT2_9ASTE|nr:hypothetical protein RJ639_027211 [Escallonia herrerae]